VLGSFFVVQKPFTAATAAAAGNVLLDVTTAAGLMLIAVGLGARLLRLLPALDLSPGETLLFSAGLGLGALGLVALGVGLAGGFTPLAAWPVTILLALLAARPLWQFRSLVFDIERPSLLIILYLTLFGLLTLLPALLPPVDWDGLFYHLTAPKLYLEAGQVIANPSVPHFNFPALMEMLFAWAMLLRGDIAAKLLHPGFGALLAGLIFQLTRRFFSSRAAWPALLIFASMPMVATLSGWAYNDLALAFYQLAALTAFLLSDPALRPNGFKLSPPAPPKGGERIEIPPFGGLGGPESDVNLTPVLYHPHSKFPIPNSQFMILSGVFAGLAMGLKYTSFVTPLLIVGLIIGQAVQQRLSLGGFFHRWIAFALTAAVVASPWYLKNWLLTGNPVHPFAYGLFGGAGWDAFRAAWYAHGGSGLGLNPLKLLGLPWLLTLGVNDANYWDGRTGPLLLLFLPLVIWAALAGRFGGQPAPPATRPVLLYALAHFAVWTLGVVWSQALWQARLLLPGLVALIPVSAWVWRQLPSFDLPQFRLSRVVNMAIVLTLTLTLVDIGLLTLKIDPLPYLAGLENRPAFLSRRLGAHYAAMEALNSLPAEARVVFLWEPRSYYCRRDCAPDSILDELAHLVDQHGTAAAIAQSWQAAGVSHILLHRAGFDFMRSTAPELANQATLEQLIAHHLTLVSDVGGIYQLYRLR
jgi:hypothetical protein